MRRPPSNVGRQRGAILMTTIWIVLFLASLVLVFARSARTDLAICANQVALVQASSVERSAEQYVLQLIEQQKETVLTLAESYFAAIQVTGGYFWILRPDYGDTYFPFFGLVDEGGKVNLNTANASMLRALPGLDSEIAASIVDWRDADSEPTDGGAEDEYYLALPRPYRTKNAPFETIEELLMVKGVKAELLYGSGVGSRYGADPNWASGFGSNVKADLQLSRGIYDDLTIYSKEATAAAGGTDTAAGGAGGRGGDVGVPAGPQPPVQSGGGGGGGAGGQVDVNDENTRPVLDLLAEALDESRADALRPRVAPRPPFRDVFDFGVRLGLTGTEFDAIAARITTGGRAPTQGLINVLTAPREVLLCLPDMTDSDVSELISQRTTAVTSGTTTLGWVLDALKEKSVGLANQITTKSSVFSADLLAVNENGRAFRRSRVVFDARTSPPKIIFRRSLGEAGWPLDPSLLLSLRQGLGVPAGYSMTGSGMGGGL